MNHIIEAGRHVRWWWWWWRWHLRRTPHAHLGHEVCRLCLAMLLCQTHRQRLGSSLRNNVVQRRYCLLCFLAFVVPASTNGAYNEWGCLVDTLVGYSSFDLDSIRFDLNSIGWMKVKRGERMRISMIDRMNWVLYVCMYVARWGFVESITISYIII